MFKVLMLSLCLVLVSVPPNTIMGQDTPVTTPAAAEVVVEAPDSAISGELVVISVMDSKATDFKWIVIPETDNFMVIDGGRRAVFTSGFGGEFKFIIACAEEGTVDVVVHTIFVEGTTDSPTPTPNVNSWNAKVSRWCNKIKSANKKSQALSLAQSFSSVALVMDGGTLVTPKDIVTATFKANQHALGDNLELWMPFREGLKIELTRLADAGTLSDTESHIAVWKDIAKALRNYADKL